jgi:cell division septum initiation protein DivIVA
VAGNEPELDVTAGMADVRDPLPAELRDPDFSGSVRGYDRHAVDACVERVNRLIAEMQVSGSPKAAVRHALDRVGEQTSSILQRARETAEEITSSAREEAEDTTARAKAEAEEIVAGAQARARDVVARAEQEAEGAIARARVDAEGRVRRADEEVGRLEQQSRERLEAMRADMAAVVDERKALVEEVRRISTRLAEVVADAEPEPAAAVAPDTNGADAAAHGPPA